MLYREDVKYSGEDKNSKKYRKNNWLETWRYEKNNKS